MMVLSVEKAAVFSAKFNIPRAISAWLSVRNGDKRGAAGIINKNSRNYVPKYKPNYKER
jgi:hypothetical protein